MDQTSAVGPPKYKPRTAFHRNLEQRIAEHFAGGESMRGGWRALSKALLLVAVLVAAYLYLLLLAGSWWEGILGCLLVALVIAGLGFNVQHDANHGALAHSKLGNRLAGGLLDALGGSSHYWCFKHNILHHQYPNVDGFDDDLAAEPFLRLGRAQTRRWAHRHQWIYAWLLYGVLALKWQLYDDFASFARRRIGEYPVARPRGWGKLQLFGGKLFFVGWALVVPLTLLPWWVVVLAYVGTMGAVGVISATVFQLAHCVEGVSQFDAGRHRPQHGWAEHQLATTCNFAPDSRLLTWYLGGLNHQVEHHLFPKIAHRHYRRLSPIVAATCAEWGVPYRQLPSFGAALRAHVRYLRQAGRTDELSAAEGTPRPTTAAG